MSNFGIAKLMTAHGSFSPLAYQCMDHDVARTKSGKSAVHP